MAYIPNPEWQSDTAITSAKLNHIQEQYDEIIDYLGTHDHDTRYYTQALMDSYFWNVDSDGPGTGLDADTLEGTEAADIHGGVDPGLVTWYYGTLDDFTDKRLNSDTTWHIADGTDGTIDLPDYFVIGAGGSYAVGASGGNYRFKPAGSATIASHVLTIAEIQHTHTMSDYYPWGGVSATSWLAYEIAYSQGLTSKASTTSSAGSGTAHDHPGSFAGDWSSLLPPYRALIPIQKMSS